MKQNSTQSAFAIALASNIRAYIKQARKEGTTAMGLECLMQCVKTPSPSLQGAPLGTNARYYYAQAFREVCQARDIAGFLLP